MANGTESSWPKEHGSLTRLLAGVCHGCQICPHAAGRPGSAFDRVMRWHRTWCPAWIAHSKVYGPKKLGTPLSGADPGADTSS